MPEVHLERPLPLCEELIVLGVHRELPRVHLRVSPSLCGPLPFPARQEMAAPTRAASWQESDAEKCLPQPCLVCRDGFQLCFRALAVILT